MAQSLPPEAYTSPDWFRQERETLFSRAWSWVGMETDLKEPGDYFTATVHGHPLAVLLDADGVPRVMHNLCRHRGTELLEGRGNAGKTLVCPYHRWTYGLDGALRGVPNRSECFPHLDRSGLSLHQASIGIWKGLIFANPAADQDFTAWIGPLDAAPFPHDTTDPSLQMGDEFVYRIKCNWKVFYENAIDGYHLAYLHENTLGGPVPGKNIWDQHGDHLVWYSTERDEVRNRVPNFVQEQADSYGMTKIKGAETPGYGGVYMLFPGTIITPSPWSLTVSSLEPIDAGNTILRARSWTPRGWFSSKEAPKEAPGFDPDTGLIESRNWTKPPLETGDFQTEDIWVCEKMQRSLVAPNYEVGPLSAGSGGEAMLPIFQNQVRAAMQRQLPD